MKTKEESIGIHSASPSLASAADRLSLPLLDCTAPVKAALVVPVELLVVVMSIW